MKQRKQSKQKGKISELVMGIIKARGLDAHKGKDGVLSVVSEVKKRFPSSKFGPGHFYWYRSRYRRQKKAGVGVDSLHIIKKGKKK